MSGVTFRIFSSPVQISTHGTFLCHVFTDGSLFLSFIAELYISSAAKFSTTLLTFLFIYNRLLRKIRGPKKKEKNIREKNMMTSFTICSPHTITCVHINEDEMDGPCGM
jgi:hypothetical protein